MSCALLILHHARVLFRQLLLQSVTAFVKPLLGTNQVKQSRQPRDTIVCHEVSCSRMNLKPCAQSPGEVIRCRRRHERIRVGAKNYSFSNARYQPFNINVSCEETIKFRQSLQWFSEPSHYHKTTQFPWFRQRREYPQGGDRTQ